jgi:hypothetical protein
MRSLLAIAPPPPARFRPRELALVARLAEIEPAISAALVARRGRVRGLAELAAIVDALTALPPSVMQRLDQREPLRGRLPFPHYFDHGAILGIAARG